MNTTASVAISGCGRVAGSESHPVESDFKLSHAAGYHFHPRFELLAACDPNPEQLIKFAKNWGVPKSFESLEDMLKNVQVDVLSIASPTECHKSQFFTALSRGVPLVFLEKPLSWRYLDSVQMARNAEEGKTVTLVNYFRRFNPAYRQLKSLLDSKALGDLQRVVVFYNKGLVHNGSHFIDLLRWLFGEFKTAQTVWSREINKYDVDADVVFALESGIPVTFQNLKSSCYNLLEVDILLEDGRVRITESGRSIRIFEPETDRAFPHLKTLSRSGYTVDNPWPTVYMNIMDHMADLLDETTLPHCGLADGVACMAVCEAALRSAREGRIIHISEVNDGG